MHLIYNQSSAQREDLDVRSQNRKVGVIVGGGFGGLSAAKELANKEVDVTLIDKNYHHTFRHSLCGRTALVTPTPSTVHVKLAPFASTPDSTREDGGLSHKERISQSTGKTSG